MGIRTKKGVRWVDNFDSIDQIIAVARMYYEGKLTQSEISRRVNLSCPTISRMLKKAKEKGKLRLELKCDAGGLAIYGRNAGRFPMDIEILPKL